MDALHGLTTALLVSFALLFDPLEVSSSELGRSFFELSRTAYPELFTKNPQEGQIGHWHSLRKLPFAIHIFQKAPNKYRCLTKLSLIVTLTSNGASSVGVNIDRLGFGMHEILFWG